MNNTISLVESRTFWASLLALVAVIAGAFNQAGLMTWASDPATLLLDEPFVSLDAPLARQLQRDLAHLVESRRMTTVLVTHDVAEAIALADRIFVLSARPAHVIGEVRVGSPRSQMSSQEEAAIVAQIEALRLHG